MKPSEPPAEPIVATMTISVVVIFVFDTKKIAKKNSAAIVGPSSMTPNDSVRYEFIAHRTTDSTSPAAMLRNVIGGIPDIRATVLLALPGCPRGRGRRTARRPRPRPRTRGV